MSIFRKAERKKAKLRLAITGPAGSGKTYGALLVAFGIGGKIALLDTENGSGDLYSKLGDYDVCAFSAPFSVLKFIEAIKDAEISGYDILILDSISAEWAGSGGLLNLHTQFTSGNKANSFAAWGKITPQHNAFIDAIINSRLHIIATIRSKTEYALFLDEHGKSSVRKLGMGLVQRDGIDYEFTTVFDLNADHSVTVSKDRTSLFDGQIFTLTQETGKLLKDWLESGIDVPDIRAINELKQSIYKKYLARFSNDQKQAQEAILAITQGRGSKDWTDDDLNNLQADIETRKSDTAELPQAV